VASVTACVCVCPSVRAQKGKRLELSTPNSVHAYSTAVARHALTRRSKGQRSRSQKRGRRTEETYGVGLQLIDGQFVHEYFGVLGLLDQLWLKSYQLYLHVVDQDIRLQKLRQTVLDTITCSLQLSVYAYMRPV